MLRLVSRLAVGLAELPKFGEGNTPGEILVDPVEKKTKIRDGVRKGGRSSIRVELRRGM